MGISRAPLLLFLLTLTPFSLALALHLSRYPAGLPEPPSPSAPILLTDLPVLLPLQTTNVALNQLSPTYVLARPLPWGAPLSEHLPGSHAAPDVVLAADCVYHEPTFPLLLATLDALLGPHAVCWFAMKRRRRADARFVAGLRKAFAVREIKVERTVEEKGVEL